MNGQSRSAQRGISFLGLVFVGAVLAGVGLVGLQVLPTYLEFLSIEKAVNKAKDGSTVADIRRTFDLAAEVDQIQSIKGADLDISKDGDKVVVAFAYNKELPLFGPAFLLLKYAGRSK